MKNNFEQACRIADGLSKIIPSSCLSDILLYGGFALGEKTKDIDMIIVGNLDFLGLGDNSLIPGSIKLSNEMKERLSGLASDSSLFTPIQNELEVDIGNLKPKFFSDLNYRVNLSESLKGYDPLFFYNLLEDGIIYNLKSKNFDISAKHKYDPTIRKSIKDRHSYFGVTGY